MMNSYTSMRCRFSFPCLLLIQFCVVFHQADSIPNSSYSKYQVIDIFPEERVDSYLPPLQEESAVKRQDLTLPEIPFFSMVSADLDPDATDKELSPYLPDAQVSNSIKYGEIPEVSDLASKMYDRYQKMGELDMPLSFSSEKSPPRKRVMEIKLELGPIERSNRAEIVPETSENQLQTIGKGQWSFLQYGNPILFKGHPSKRSPQPEPDPGNGDENTETGLTLSITSPLEVLRQKIRIDNQKFRLKQQNRKNKSNSRYLKDLGR